MIDEKKYREVIIPQKLAEIEEQENVRILFCAEAGSRAWGFPSPDSDFDVRFIYVRPKEFYLRLDNPRDVIEWQLDDVLDINGWDLPKALMLLHNSNPTLFEWNNSPIVYKTTPEWEEIADVFPRYFQEKKALYHYLSMAKSNYKEYMREPRVKLKKYFYILRPLLACRWILEKKAPPPILFETLAEACLDKSIVPFVEELLQIKMSTPEMGEGKRIDELNAYLDAFIAEIDARLREHPSPAAKAWDELNEIFLKFLR